MTVNKSKKTKSLITRKQAADDVTEQFFPVSPRRISTWSDLTVRYIGREALYDPDEVLAAAKARLENAPLTKQCPANAARKQQAAG